jgi:integrase
MKDALAFLYETGCRPQEFRILELAWYDGTKITLPKNKSKGKKKRRVLYLNPAARALVLKWGADFNSGPLFRNSRDEPWTKDSLSCAFGRLQKKTEIDGLCAYTLRHTRITEMLKAGVDVATVAALMGNSPRMILQVYEHVAKDDKHLLNAIGG